MVRMNTSEMSAYCQKAPNFITVSYAINVKKKNHYIFIILKYVVFCEYYDVL